MPIASFNATKYRRGRCFLLPFVGDGYSAPMTVPPYPIFILAGILLLIVWWAVGFTSRRLMARGILDVPNERSSHVVPTPRGAGLALIPCLCVGWVACFPVLGLAIPTYVWVVMAGTALLASVSWRDDQNPVSPLIRFVAQWIAVLGVLILAPLTGLVFQGFLPPALDIALTAVLWVWFINVYNFMDGLDGITGVQTASVGIGVIFVAGLSHQGVLSQAHGLMLIAASIGFLRWNWHPAKIFMGDVGSIGLGFLIGWLLLTIAAQGQPVPALILVLYYAGDATVTVIRRAVRGEKIWQAHREHFYQRAVQQGQTHAQVSAQIFILNLGLIGCASVATLYHKPWIGLAVAAVMVAMTMAHFRKPLL